MFALASKEPEAWYALGVVKYRSTYYVACSDASVTYQDIRTHGALTLSKLETHSCVSTTMPMQYRVHVWLRLTGCFINVGCDLRKSYFEQFARPCLLSALMCSLVVSLSHVEEFRKANKPKARLIK